jgi:hypothetical protein
MRAGWRTVRQMEVLYVVEFDVGPGSGPAQNLSAYEVLLELVTDWLAYRSAEPLAVDVLSASGRFTRYDGGGASWETIEAGSARAVRVVVRQEQSADVVFETRVTVGDVDGSATLRVSLARESTAPGLAPMPEAILRQPVLVLTAASDDRVTLRVDGAPQDGKYLRVRNDSEAHVVVDSLRARKRLPVLLIQPRDDQGWDAAKTASKRLIGLVRVVVANYRTARPISELMPVASIPTGGATLVWSDSSAAPVKFEASDLAAEPYPGATGFDDQGTIRARLMQLLAGMSVRARGDDRAWRAVRSRALTQELEAAAETLAAEQAAGNLEGQLAALSNENAALRSRVQEAGEFAELWDAELHELADERDALRLERDLLQAERNTLKAKADALEAQFGQAPAPRSLEERLAEVPPLAGRDPSATFHALEEATGGRLAFTPRASVSWRKSKVTDSEAVTQALTALARIPDVLYGSDAPPLIEGRLDDWIHATFGITVAFQDSTVEGTNALRYFNFEDQEYDRLPHVKVTDNTAWPKVARIHFARDPEGGRFIVDHVGNKLYK